MRRKFLVAGLATMALSTGGTLTAVASPAFASSGGTISVAYENYGTNITLNNLMVKVKGEFQKQYPGWTVNLEPIAARGKPLLHQTRPDEQLFLDGTGCPLRGHVLGQQ